LTDTLESIGDGFNHVDSGWRYRFVNRQAARLIGQPSAQLPERVSGTSIRGRK
jgi:PAS domain-containing protein